MMTVFTSKTGRETGAVDGDFRSLFETHPSPMWVYDPATLQFLIVNRAAQELYGYRLEDFATMTVLDIRPPYERRRMLDAVQMRTDIEKAERWEHLKADGEIFHVLTYGREVRLEGRAAILAIVQDRTELNAAEREAVAARTLLDSIVDNLPIGVFVKDMQDDGRYIRYNEACSAITGVSPEAVIGSSDMTLFGAEQAGQFLMQDRRAFGSPGTTHAEEAIARPDGTSRTVRTLRRSLPSPDGKAPRYLIGIAQDVTEERLVKAELERLAMQDVLTGLPNRAAFTEHIRRRLEAIPLAGPCALLYVDVDHFKHINDSMGHPAGDRLLCEISRCLLALSAEGDFVARLGGDEFAVLIDTGPSGEEPRMFADRLFRAMQTPFDLDGFREYASCSIGIALSPSDGTTEDVLMRSADLALYAAKDAGRSTYRFYNNGLRLAAERRHLIAGELREAIEHRQFELHYQPIRHARTGSLVGFEALVRWRHPVRGLVSPVDFIPAAEETGLIIPLGEWVLNEACAVASLWPEPLKIAVNLSVCQFQDAGLLKTVVGVLDRTGLLPGRLEIEVTETVFLRDNAQGIPFLKAIRELGVRIAIDDFGTGYSSLGYLRSFPFDKIKLDRSFVSSIHADAGNLAIVRAVAGIARGFNATTLAEGIETDEQLEILRAEGFDEIQGYLIGRPMPCPAAEALIASEWAPAAIRKAV